MTGAHRVGSGPWSARVPTARAVGRLGAAAPPVGRAGRAAERLARPDRRAGARPCPVGRAGWSTGGGAGRRAGRAAGRRPGHRRRPDRRAGAGRAGDDRDPAGGRAGDHPERGADGGDPRGRAGGRRRRRRPAGAPRRRPLDRADPARARASPRTGSSPRSTAPSWSGYGPRCRTSGPGSSGRTGSARRGSCTCASTARHSERGPPDLGGHGQRAPARSRGGGRQGLPVSRLPSRTTSRGAARPASPACSARSSRSARAVGLGGPLGDPAPGVVAEQHHSRPACQPTGQHLVRDQLADRVGERGRVAGREPQPGEPVLDELPEPAHVRGHHRRTGRRGLQRHQPERLVRRGNHRAVRRRDERGQLGVRHEAGEAHRPAQPQPPGQLPQLGVLRPAAGDHHPDSGVPPAQPGDRGEQVVHALLVHQPPGEGDQRPVAGPPAARRRDPLGERPPALAGPPRWAPRRPCPAAGRTAGSPPSACTTEQVMTRRASYVSHHSTEWIERFSGAGSQPWCRPASVACRVATSGTRRWCLSVVGRVRDQPVVRVHDVRRLALAGEREAGPGQRVVERHRPGQQLVGEAQQRRVLRPPGPPGRRRPPRRTERAGRRAGRRRLRVPGQHRDLVAAAGQSPRPARARAGPDRRPAPAGTPRTASARAPARCSQTAGALAPGCGVRRVAPRAVSGDSARCAGPPGSPPPAGLGG